MDMKPGYSVASEHLMVFSPRSSILLWPKQTTIFLDILVCQHEIAGVWFIVVQHWQDFWNQK